MPVHTGLTSYVAKLAEVRIVMDIIGGGREVESLSSLVDTQAQQTIAYIRDSLEAAPTPYRAARRWFFLRQLISLQSRLLIEYAMWQLGKPWSDLVTGFRPGEITEALAGLEGEPEVDEEVGPTREELRRPTRFGLKFTPRRPLHPFLTRKRLKRGGRGVAGFRSKGREGLDVPWWFRQ